jgi:hypothetical protein
MSIAGKSEPVFNREQGTGGAFGLIVVFEVPFDDLLVHVSQIADDVDSVVGIGNVDFRKRAKFIGLKVLA